MGKFKVNINMINKPQIYHYVDTHIYKKNPKFYQKILHFTKKIKILPKQSKFYKKS